MLAKSRVFLGKRLFSGLTALSLLFCAGSAAAVAEAPETAQTLCISELMVKNRAVLQDADGDFPDWIEVENRSAQEISLRGWRLSDRENKAGFSFPGGVLGPGERLLVFASGKNRPEALHADFSLAEGETVYLYNPSGALVSSAPCLGGTGGSSVILAEDGAYAESLYPTPGYPNTAAGYDAWQASLETGSGLAIWEVMAADPADRYTDVTGNGNWVELKNTSAETLNLGDYCLSDDHEDYTLYALPARSLQPGERVVLPISKNVAGFSISATEDELYLSTAAGELVDYVSLRDIPYEGSYGRMDGENGWFFFASPTPGGANTDGYRRVSAAPTAESADGIYNGLVGSLAVTLSAPGRIHYSTDGSLPDEASPLYTEPLSVNTTTVIRAVAIEEGALPSRALTLSYIVNEYHKLPVISLVSDNLRDMRDIYEYRMKGIELSGNLAMYEDAGVCFSIGCGISMHGATSLYLDKKNLSVRFRGAYGQDRLEYDIYGGEPSFFSNLVLRAGQDFPHAIIRNEFAQNLALNAGSRAVTQRNQYCILYLNGTYWGIYNLMEKANGRHFADVAGVSHDSVTVWEANVPDTSSLYWNVFSFCQSNDMSLAENYEEFCRRMDVDSLIDWLILEGYFANLDLYAGNLRYWCSSELDGKWRLAFYDLDAIMNNPSMMYVNVLLDPERQYYQIVHPLMSNAAFRDRFLTRAGELLNGPLSNAAAVAEIDRLAGQIAPEVYRDYDRYGMYYESWEWNVDFLRSRFLEENWQRQNIDMLCSIFQLTEQERSYYFGD